MIDQSNGDEAQISFALIPVDEEGHDAAGTGQKMCACSFKYQTCRIRWLATCAGAVTLSRHVAHEIIPLFKGKSRKPALVICNGTCNDEQGIMNVHGETVEDLVIQTFAQKIRRELGSVNLKMSSLAMV